VRVFLGILLLCLGNAAQSINYEANFADLYETHSESVVTVYTASLSITNGNYDSSKGVGSGVLIDADHILTAAHVIKSAQVIEVLFTDGERILADVLSSLESSDVALLKLRSSHPAPTVAVLANSDQTRIGSEVFIIGAPFGISQTLSVGHLSGRMNRGQTVSGTPIEFLQTDAAINIGNSGGPMFNTDGEVIGIVSFIFTKSGGYDGIGFATAINTAKQALLSSTGVAAGFEGITLDENMAKTLNFPEPGLLVQRVFADSIIGRAGLKAGTVPAEVAGKSLLLGGDLIIEIDGMAYKSPLDLELVKEPKLALIESEPYTITVFRNGEVIDLIAGAHADDTNFSDLSH